LNSKFLAEIHPKLSQIGEGLGSLLTAQGAIDSRKSSIGTSSISVEKQIAVVAEATATARDWISNAQERFSGMMSL
jgi:hypothetical protein